MKPQRLTPLTNASRHPWRRVAVVVAPALVALLALGGVTAPGALSVRALHASVELARSRTEEARRERALHRDYVAQDVEARAQRALDEARSHTPESVDPIVAQGFVRVACERTGVELESLAIGGDRDPLAPQGRERVIVRIADLAGTATPNQLLALLDELEALGAPACVLQINLDARSKSGRGLEFRMQLGLFHFAPLAVVDTLAEPSPTTETP